MRKITVISFCLVILSMCATPLVLGLFGVDTPNLEKRALAPRPVLVTSGSGLNGSFTQDLDDYIADHFPLRTALISAWHQLNISLLSQSGNDRVILGQDSWLFFAETAPSFTGADLFSKAEYARLGIILRLQAEYLESRDIRFLYTVAPNKSTVYPDRMPGRYPDMTNDNTLAGLPGAIGTGYYINLRDLLREKAVLESRPIYHRTDSHWNNAGALMACNAILGSISPLVGKTLSTPYNDADYTEIADWQGDLAVMLFPSGSSPDIQQRFEVEPSYRYKRPLKSLEDLLISTEGNGTGSLLMFRDSFANALIPMLSEAFENVTYSRAVPYDYALLDNLPADVVLLEIAERNLRTWLSSPPRMPAIPFQGGMPDYGNADAGLDPDPDGASSQADIAITAEKDRDDLKISGQLTGGLISRDWSQVLIVIGEKAYEAFPVTIEGQLDTAGFTLYLDAGTWMSGQSDLQILLKNGHEWLSYKKSTDLP